MGKGKKEGIDEEFLTFVIILCEWWYRIARPTKKEMEQSLKARLETSGFDPYEGKLFFQKQISGGVRQTINRYIDSQLRKLWNGRQSEQSRVLLHPQISDLASSWAKPFRIATNSPVKLKPGPRPWLAPWVASIVLYSLLREKYPDKNSIIPIDLSLDLYKNLSGKRGYLDQAAFHRKRRELEKVSPPLVHEFQQTYLDTLNGRADRVADLIRPNAHLFVFRLPELEAIKHLGILS